MVKRRGSGSSGPRQPKNSRNDSTSDDDETFEEEEDLNNLRDSDSDSDSDSNSDSDSDIEDEDRYEPNKRTPDHTLMDLKGIDEIKKRLRKSVIVPFALSKEAAVVLKDIPKGILLTGLPGTGKTAIADAIVSEVRRLGVEVNFYRENGACVCKWVGESEGNLRKLFKIAKEQSPSVIFIDELDTLGRSRDDDRSQSGGHSIVTTLLTELNDLTPGKVLLIAATNHPQLCDAALIRQGRFDHTINVPLPNPEAREQILEHYLDKKGQTLNPLFMAELVERTENSPGSDLKGLVGRIYDNALERIFPDNSWGDLSKKEALAQLRKLEIDWDQDIEPEVQPVVPKKKIRTRI